jgi:hypothetical protein|tara:strand:+ start:308 stop:496 length:189 start_codon:yes stop_codon:yes gene_type:complete
MLKYAILILLVFVVGCKTLPNFPIVWFYSNNDLLKQEDELTRSLQMNKLKPVKKPVKKLTIR